MQLDPRQLSTLNEMGIPVWELRPQPLTEVFPIGGKTNTVQLDKDLLQRDWLMLIDQQKLSEQAHRLLNAMLLAIGLKHQDVAIVTSEQLPQLEQVSSERKMLISFGDVNAELLLGEAIQLDNERGKIHQILASNVNAIVSFGLEELLEKPEKKALVWQDLLLAKSVYEQKI